MIRLVSRSIGLMLLAAGFTALVIDGTRSIAAAKPVMTPLSQTLAWLLPNKVALLKPIIERDIHPLLWDPVMVHLLNLPTWLVSATLGAAVLLFARQRSRLIGFTSRP